MRSYFRGEHLPNKSNDLYSQGSNIFSFVIPVSPPETVFWFLRSSTPVPAFLIVPLVACQPSPTLLSILSTAMS